jgi:phosphatidylglycerophosphate synthase
MTASEPDHPVTERESWAATMERLRSHQKPSRGAPLYSRLVNRPLGRAIAAWAFGLGLSPNQVTAVSAALSAAGIAVLALAQPAIWVGLVVAVLLVAGYAVDSADGQLARLRGGGSPDGEWRDHTVDAVKLNLLHAVVFIRLDLAALENGWRWAALAFLVVANVFFFSYILTDLLTRLGPRRSATSADPSPLWRSLLAAPTDYGILCLVFLLWGATPWFMAGYFILLVGTAGYLVLGLPRWFRAMRRLAP